MTRDVHDSEYPRDLERTAIPRDGTPIFIRPIRHEDAPRLAEAYRRLSKQSAYLRFFTTRRRLPPEWARDFADVDYRWRMALIAERETVDQPELIGVGRYTAGDSDEIPEVALAVLDGWQGRGLGIVLLHDVLRAGQSRGFRRFRASVLVENRRMLDLLARYTDVKERKIDSGVVELTFEPRSAASTNPRARPENP